MRAGSVGRRAGRMPAQADGRAQRSAGCATPRVRPRRDPEAGPPLYAKFTQTLFDRV
jgi:hypothetical protein